MNGPRPKLNFRSRKILYAVISEYISSGEPVGSRRIAKGYGLELSPATIRNVLSDLEEAGLLKQPHTSAGRVPTDQGFRLFVDALIQIRQITMEDRAAIVSRMTKLALDGENFLQEAGKLLSALTGAAAVITTPRPEEEPLAQLHFMPLREGQLLSVLVTRSGAVQNRAITAPGSMSPGQLERVNNYLAELVSNRTLAEIRETLAVEVEGSRELHQQAQSIVGQMEATNSDVTVLISGQDRLFDRREFESADTIRRYLRTFEEKEGLLHLLDQTLVAGGVHVLIGSETNLDDVTDISLISAKYRQHGASGGALGIIGPTRMDYAKVVPLVGFTADYLSEMLNESDDSE